MITIKCGTCGTSQGYKAKADGPISLPASEEARLVARGVAEYVTRPVIGAETAVATAQNGPAGDGTGGNLPPDGTPGNEPGNANPDDDGKTPEIIDGHFTVESLMETMTRKQLETMAKDMGLDVSKCNNKGDVAVLIASVEVAAEDGDGDETPPQITPEDPV